MINKRSDEVKLDGTADLIFIDGDQSFEGCSKDVIKYVPEHLKPGGYFVLHDYFGWFDEAGNNHSPIKKVVDELAGQEAFQHILIDTCFMSFVVFRRINPLIDF